MDPIKHLLNTLRLAARLEAAVVAVKESSSVSASAMSALYSTEYSARAILEDIVKALAAQQLADHITADLETLPKVTV